MTTDSGTESLLCDRPLLTAEAFLDHPDDGERSELVRGEIVREPLPGYGHASVAATLCFHLRRFVRQERLGRVVGEAGFVLERGPDTVRGPDVSFVAAARDAARPAGEGFFEGAPDLAVEILSPSNRRREMSEKVLDYLAAGARLVWIVDPRKRTVTVHAAEARPRHLTEEDRLDGGDVLPGFSLAVGRIFAD